MKRAGRLQLRQIVRRDAKRLQAIDAEIRRVIAWTFDEAHPSVVRLRNEREECTRRMALIREGHGVQA